MLTEAQAAEIIQLADTLADAAVTNAVVANFTSQEAEEDAELALIAVVGGLISHNICKVSGKVLK
jgi:hypothetical protein